MAAVGSFALWIFPFSIILLATPCFGETKFVYFGDFNSCDSTTTVDREDRVEVQGERSTAASSSAFTDCSLLFKARDIDDKLCVKINKIEFKKDTLELQYFTTLDPTGIVPNQTFSVNTNPTEICSNQREISMKLHRKVDTASIRDIVMDIQVISMQGTQRIAHMDEDCGIRYDLSDSTVHVQNTNSQGERQVHRVCQLYFKYVGTDTNKTVCLEFMRLKSDCGYDLKIIDGSSDSEVGFKTQHTYNCENDQPQQWCSDRKAAHLELINKGSTSIAASTFSVTVKDGVKGAVTFPNGGPDPPPFPVWAIVVIVIVAVAVVVGVGFFVVKKSKGMKHSEVHMGQI